MFGAEILTQKNIDRDEEEKCFYAFYDTVLGEMTIACRDSEITAIEFGRITDVSGIERKTELLSQAAMQLEEYFAGKRRSFTVPLHMSGTKFQCEVWRALCLIPYGETRSYKQLAEMVGNPKACRAVGMANNKNSIAVMIPCHRVIGADGSLTGYAGGLEIKKKLLELENNSKFVL